MKTKERRNSYRHRVLNCRADYVANGVITPAIVYNISDTGCFLEIVDGLLPKIGSSIDVVLYLSLPLTVITALPVKAIVKHACWDKKKVIGFGVVWDLRSAHFRDSQLLAETKIYYREQTLQTVVKRILTAYYNKGGGIMLIE